MRKKPPRGASFAPAHVALRVTFGGSRLYGCCRVGARLRAWLATNPFSLATVQFPSREIPNPPAWFPKKTDGFTIQQSPIGNMLLLTAPGGSPVYFTDHGQGFTRPAATTAPPPAPNPPPQNRLPNAPPPIPQD